MVNKMNLQESILKAVNTIVEQRTNELKVDKTITAIIEKNMGVFNGKTLYRLMYEGGFFEAVVLNTEEIYLPNTSVYVLVPEGNFSKEKVIIGQANNINFEKKSSTITDTPNQYCLVGGNLLYNTKKDDTVKTSDLQYGVHSYHDFLEENDNPDTILHRYNQICCYGSNEQYEESYNRQELEDEKALAIYDQNLAFNIEGLNILKEQATALMVKANFKTNLTTEQRQRSEGEYGLILNFVFNNLNKDYGSTNGEIFEKIADIIVGKTYISGKQANDFNCTPINDDLNVYDYYDIKLKDIHNYYIDQINNFNKDIKSNIRLLIEYTNSLKTIFSTNNTTKVLYTDTVENVLNSYLIFLNELELTNNIENFNELYNNWWTKIVGDTEDKIISYKISSNNMIGNPLSFNQWNTQYQILDIDIKNLIRVDSIILYKKGFLENSESELNWPLNNPGPDILVKNIQIYPVKPIENKNEDYTLKVQPKILYNDFNANILTGTDSTDIVAFEAIFMRKKIENLTKNTRVSYSWFKEDFSIINSNSIGYNAIAGPGWIEIPLAKGYNFITSGNNNLAYKNNYKCIVQYIENENNTVVLDTIFTIYNKSINTDILLESDIGTTFNFLDNNRPKIICKINENLNNSDVIKNYQEIPFIENEEFQKYNYYWAITNTVNGNKIFLNDIDNEFNNTLIEDNTIRDIIENIEYRKLNSNLEEVPTQHSIEATRIICPVDKINSNFTIDCSIKQRVPITGSSSFRYVDAGSATLEFLNKGLDIDLNSFKISIENGNQIFQYDEYGNAPNAIKNKEPLEILPLQVKVFSPSGAEIKNSNYLVEWIFPIENSMISATLPLEKNGNDFVYRGSICDFDIIKLYNPNYWNNQITCRVTYNNQSLHKDTNFLFTKIGENGTNGTDVTAKIYYTGEDGLNTLHYNPLTIYIQNANNKTKAMLNVPDGNGKRRILSENLQLIGDKGILNVTLYQKGTEISSSNYAATYPRWNLLGNSSYSSSCGKYINIVKVNDTYNINWNGSANLEKELYQIIKVEVQLKTGQTYYATYNIPFIWYANNNSILDINNLIAIDRSNYLSSVLYNADGRNPTYNHNQGLRFINIPDNITKILWEAKGGCFNFLLGEENIVKTFEQVGEIESQAEISILPNDIYDGGIVNNYVQASFYSGENLVAIAYVPIYMSLNTFGLASLNAWDGNHITINEDEGYMMSPQIGVGEKDDNNRFTGILMGKTEGEVGHTGQQESQTGLFGYTKGIQSIFLDAKTGNATFGLPNGLHLNEDGNLEEGNNFNEGRIELRPGGESTIGGWILGNKSLYRTNKKELDENNNEKWVYSGKLEKRTLHDYIPNWKTGLIEKDLKDKYFKHHERDIKYDESGILLYTGESPYISIKGRPFSEEDIPENELSEKESIIKANDSLELQLDTATPTLFTIFRHNGGNREGIEGTAGDNNNYEVGSRTFLAGINSQGEFIANSLRTANTTDIVVPIGSEEEKIWKAGSLITKFAINTLNAFDDFTYEPVPKTSHIGFEITANEENTLAHFFTKINGLKIKADNDINENYNPTLHISGGYTDEDGEYSRPLALHGKNIQMYALDGSGKDPLDDKFLSETDAGLKISKDEAKLQLGSTYFNLFRDNTENTNTLMTVNDLQINAGLQNTLNNSMIEEFDAGNGNWKSLDTQLSYKKYKKFNAENCYIQDRDSLNKVVKSLSNKYVNLNQMNKYFNKINNNLLTKYYIDLETNEFIPSNASNFYYKTDITEDDDYVLIDSYNNNVYYKNNQNEIKKIEEIYRFSNNDQNYYPLTLEEKSELNTESLARYYVSIEKTNEEKINEQYEYISEIDFNNNIFYANEYDLENYVNIDNIKDIYYKKQNSIGNIVYVNKDRINPNAEPFIIMEHEKNIFGFTENVQHYWRNSFDNTLYFRINIDGKFYYVTNFVLDTYIKDENEEWQWNDSKTFYTDFPDHSYWYQKYYEQTINSALKYIIRPSFTDDKPDNNEVAFEMTTLDMVDFNKDVNFNDTNILNIYKKYTGELQPGMYQYLLKDEIERAKSYYHYYNSTDFYSNLENDEDNKTYYKLKNSDNFIEITSEGELFYYNEKNNNYILLNSIDLNNFYVFENNIYQEINIEDDIDYNLLYRKILIPKEISEYKWVNLSQWLNGEPLREYCLTTTNKYVLKNSFSTSDIYLKINNKYVFVNSNFDNFNYIYIEDNKSSEPFFVSVEGFKEIFEDNSNYWLIINSNIYDIGDKGWIGNINEDGIILNNNENIRKRSISESYSNQKYSVYSGIYKNYIQKNNNTYTKIDIDNSINIENTRSINLSSNNNLDIKLSSNNNSAVGGGQISLINRPLINNIESYNINNENIDIYGQFVRIETNELSNNNIETNKYGLILGLNSTSLLGENLNYIKSKKQIKITSAQVGTGLTYTSNNPQILLVAGEEKLLIENKEEDHSTKLILNSSDNGWINMGTGEDVLLSYPTFKIQSQYGYIGMFPWYEINNLYSERFHVNMSQVITNGLMIQGQYGNKIMDADDAKNKTQIGLHVIKNIQARKFIGQDWNSLFITPPREHIFGTNGGSVSGLGGKLEFAVPRIELQEKGQPKISNKIITITLPNSDNIWNAISGRVESKINDAIRNIKNQGYLTRTQADTRYVTKTNYNNHRHNVPSRQVRVGTTVGSVSSVNTDYPTPKG